MASKVAPRLFSRSYRQLSRPQRSIISLNARRAASTKHPQGFVPPTNEDLNELRERVQEFTRVWYSSSVFRHLLTCYEGREIPEELAQITDHSNAFPNDMWQKLGGAGLLGITADEDYGGLAMGYQAHCVVMEEISRASGEFQCLKIGLC